MPTHDWHTGAFTSPLSPSLSTCHVGLTYSSCGLMLIRMLIRMLMQPVAGRLGSLSQAHRTQQPETQLIPLRPTSSEYTGCLLPRTRRCHANLAHSKAMPWLLSGCDINCDGIQAIE